MAEHEEQAALMSMCSYDRRLRWLFAIPNGGQRNVRVAVKLKMEGVKAGVWDLFLPVPSQGYHGLFIEMKYGHNKLTPEQVEFREHLEVNHYKTAVCYSAEDAYAELESYLGENDNAIDKSTF